MSSILDRITEILQQNNLDRSDMDELAILVQNIKDDLPSRFITVVQDFDKNFSVSKNARQDFLLRLDRILGVYKEHDFIDQPTPSNELIPVFELAKKDKTRIFELCSKMRKIVMATTVFDEPHKRLMLNRIASIEYQVHQPKGWFDIVRGGVSDIGETLGKFGQDIKPLTDRAKEVLQITRKATKQYDQIPAPDEIKQIEDKSDDVGEE